MIKDLGLEQKASFAGDLPAAQNKEEFFFCDAYSL